MSDDLAQLETWAAGLLERVAPPSRRRLAIELAAALRRSQAERIRHQLSPDGEPFVPRKRRLRDKRGRIKRDQMFAKLRTARYLMAAATPDVAEVGFRGRTSRIARVHQDGNVDAVAPGGPRVRYPRRRLLGFAATDRVMIRDLLIDRLTR